MKNNDRPSRRFFTPKNAVMKTRLTKNPSNDRIAETRSTKTLSPKIRLPKPVKRKGLLYDVYETEKKIDERAFFETFGRKNVALYDVKFSPKRTTFTADSSNRSKIFAISENMCYNVSIIGYKGKFAIFARLLKRVGLIACFTVFCALAAISDGYISTIKYTGEGKYYKVELEKALFSEGLTVNSKFPKDFNATAAKIAAHSDKFSFVSIKKSGKTLEVEAYGVIGKTVPLAGEKRQIFSTADGVIRRICRYEGTSVVKVGDKVKKDDLLIDGYYEKNGEKLPCLAFGDVEIAVSENFVYKTTGEGKRFADRATLVAKEKFSDYYIIETHTKLIARNTYSVTVVYAVTVVN